MELSKNSIFAGRYRLEDRLGAGGFGEVWKAFDKVTHKYFAIKIHLKGDSEKAAQEIVREYTRVMHIHHDNLLTPSHVDITEGTVPYLVMELCNSDLSDKDLSEIEVWHLIRDVSAGLKRLAENKRAKERLDGSSSEVADPIIHQDIKPANILIRANGMYAISDFGISKRRLSSLSSTMDAEHDVDSAMTIDYAAPERFPRGKGISVLASDIWSLGAMLFEIVEGRRPFAECGGDCLNPTIGLKIPEIMRKGFSDELKQLIYDCMAKEPAHRPHADQLYIYAEEVLKGEPRKVEWPGAPKEIKTDKTKRQKSFKGVVSVEETPPTSPTPDPDPIPLPSLWEKLSRFWQIYNKTIKRLFGAIAGIVIVILLFSLWGNEERKVWYAIEKENNISSYKSFVESNLHSRYVDNALKKILRFDNADNNLEGLSYVWNNDTLTGGGNQAELADSIMSFTSRWNLFSKNLFNDVSSLSFEDYEYSQINLLRTIVDRSIEADGISNLILTYFWDPDSVSYTLHVERNDGSCARDEIYVTLTQKDINKSYRTLCRSLYLADSIFCHGLGVLNEGKYYATADFKPYYDTAIVIVNHYFDIRNKEQSE